MIVSNISDVSKVSDGKRKNAIREQPENLFLLALSPPILESLFAYTDFFQYSITVLRPSYPTSAKKQTNWDAIAKSAVDEEEKSAKEHDKDPNAGGDKKLNELFQKLYADADDNQRRAMVKSYQVI